jgi:hypothetical protein
VNRGNPAVLADNSAEFSAAVRKMAKAIVAQPEKPKKARRGFLPTFAKA